MTRAVPVRAAGERARVSASRPAARPLACALVLSSALGLGCSSEPVRLPPGAPIVLIIIDTLRADELGVYGYARPTSAALDAWAKRGAVFERAFATAPWTLPSIASMLTGRYPARHGSGRGKVVLPGGRTKRVFLGIDAEAPRLASVLSKRGYATGALVTNSFLRPGFGMAEGFDTYDQTRNRFIGERRADVMVDRALAWIDARPAGSPWFLLLHVLDPHQPYDPPPSQQGRFTAGYGGALESPIGPDSDLVRQVKRRAIELDDADRAFVRGVYDEEVAFVAAQMARFLDGLDRRQVIDRGLVLLTADHGEEFFDHGALEHGHTFYQELLHVPLLIWGHGVGAGRHPQPVSSIDLMPTILDAAAIAAPEGMDGVSLWPLLTGDDHLAKRGLIAENTLYGDQRRAIVEWPYKLIVDVESGEAALYDLERDPAERENLVTSRAEVAKRLAKVLGDRPAARSDRQPVELDAETESDLRALGYLR